MASFKDTDFQCYNSYAEDVARYKISANNALQKIQSIYNEVMGVHNIIENTPPSTVPFNESDSSIISSSLNSSRRHDECKTFPNQKCRHCHFLNAPYSTNTPAPCVYPCHVPSQTPTFYPHFCGYRTFHQYHSQCFNYLNEINTVPKQSAESESDTKSKKPTKSNSEKPKPDPDDYHLNFTIPEPFKMTIRDENQKHFKELKRQKLIDTINAPIEKEMQFKIHSHPVPAHVYLPLYRHIMKLDEMKREERKTLRAERTEEIVKPFNISSPRKKCHMHDIPTEEEKYVFRANPVPRHIFEKRFSEKIRDKEARRKLISERLAKEKLAKASAPVFASNTLSRSKSSKDLKEDAIKARINRSKSLIKLNAIPREQAKKVMEEWNSKVLQAASSNVENKITKKEISPSKARYQEFLRKETSPLKVSSIRKTTSSILKEEETRRNIESKIQVLDPEKERFRKELKEKLNSSLLHNNLRIDYQNDMDKRLEEYKRFRKQRQMEYEQELKEIQERIQNRPLLLESLPKKNNNKTIPVTQIENKDIMRASTPVSETSVCASSLASDAPKDSSYQEENFAHSDDESNFSDYSDKIMELS